MRLQVLYFLHHVNFAYQHDENMDACEASMERKLHLSKQQRDAHSNVFCRLNSISLFE